jgi:hypothetical protein
MDFNLHIKIEGIDTLQSELQGIITTNKIEHILELGAVIIEEEAKRYCPQRTGHLMLSITHHKRGSLTQEIVASMPYADAVEYGTYKMFAGTPENPYIYTSTNGHYPSYRPFLRSAAYDNFDRVVALFDKEMIP